MQRTNKTIFLTSQSYYSCGFTNDMQKFYVKNI